MCNVIRSLISGVAMLCNLSASAVSIWPVGERLRFPLPLPRPLFPLAHSHLWLRTKFSPHVIQSLASSTGERACVMKRFISCEAIPPSRRVVCLRGESHACAKETGREREKVRLRRHYSGMESTCKGHSPRTTIDCVTLLPFPTFYLYLLRHYFWMSANF